MANWKNLIINPPQEGYGYFIFKILSRDKVNEKGEPELQYVHGCIKPKREPNEPTVILFPEKQVFDTKDDFIAAHTVDPDKFTYLYLNLNEIL